MSERIEKLIAEYPTMVRDRKCLAYEIAHFRGVSADEVIESMYTGHQDGERVQTSTLSDKTAQIAMTYRTRQDEINREWREQLESQLREVSDKLSFLEGAIRSLPGLLSPVMWDLVVKGQKWEAVEHKYAISHTTVYRMRKRAIAEMEALYAQRDRAMAEYKLA